MATEAFESVTANGIEVRMWEGDRQSGRAEARRLAGKLPRGGEIDDGSVRQIEAPIKRNGTCKVWLAGDGFTNFEIPDGYKVESVSGFDSPGTCITMRRVD